MIAPLSTLTRHTTNTVRPWWRGTLCAALAGALAACAEGRSATSEAAARSAATPLRQAAAPARPLPFTGRVPRLGPGSRPADTLRLARLFGDSTQFARISSLRVLGDRLLVTDRQMSVHLVVVELESGRVERQAGRDGSGPGEFRDPFWAIPVSADPPAAWIYDFHNRRLTRFEPLSAAPPHQWESRPLDVGLPLMSPFWTRRGMVSNGLFPDFTFLLMDSAGAPRERIAADPPFGEREMKDLNGRMLLNRSFLAVRPAGDRMALAYQFRSRVDFFTTAGERYGSVEGPRRTRPSYGLQQGRFVWNDDNQMAFWGAYATDRYLYLAFSGYTLEENQYPSLVQVFTWEGDFVRELALDRPVTEIAVSPDDRFLYGGVEEPYPAVGGWRLPGG